MIPARLLEVTRVDLAWLIRRPMLWVLVLLLAVLSFGLSSGDVTISTGDTSVGGQRAWVTSQFSTAYVLSVAVFSLYTFFIAILAGMAVIRDDELKVGEILHATPLSTGEYVWGKLLAVVTACSGVLGLHLVAMVVCNHLLPASAESDIRGPFVLANYLVPALVFGLPVIVAAAGVSFAVGERTRRPILVFVVPLAAVMASLLFFWEWSPTWLDPRLNRLLMLLDPSGFRWLNETWLKVDRGVAFYNSGRIGFDLPFLLSRLGLVALGLGATVFCHARLRATLRGHRGQRAVGSRRRERERQGERAALTETRRPERALATLAMVTRPPGLLRGALAVARVELNELASSPGLYLFVPIILLQAFGNIVNSGPMDAPLLLTPGVAAARMMNALTLLVCLLLTFYTVESLWRERATGMGAITSASPLSSTALLLGKTAANCVVAAVILVAALVACVVIILVEGKVALSLAPFAILWGLLLLPTFALWTAFVSVVFAVSRSRYGTYAVALATILVTFYCRLRGKMTWVFNWDLWGVVRWTDMGPLELDRQALVLNRLLVLAVAALLVAVAVRLFPRTEQDPSQILARLQPGRLMRASLSLAPLALLPLVAGVWLYVVVDRGVEAGAAEKRAKDYWRQNLATFREAPLPALEAVELDVALEPRTSELVVSGSYRLRNHHAEPLGRFAVTTGAHFEDVRWQVNGQPAELENRTGLYVVAPEGGLAPGQILDLGFSYHGRLPAGVSKNGGGAREFILPCGVVLTSFEPSFAPVLGFVEEIGVDDDNRYEPETYPPDFYLGVTEPLFGSPSPFTTHITVSLPEAYRANSVGILAHEEVKDGRRTAEWVSDVPVRFFNIVAGRWAVRSGRGVEVYYHPEHTYNIDEMLAALEGARQFYSEWFYPFPWSQLKLSEFADLARYAQGFPTNITFSEGIGFLTKDDPRTNLAFAVAAHEAAHQWWGNLLTPGKGPGGNVVAEGLSHFSAALLVEQVRGPLRAMEFRKRIESSYASSRRADAERALVAVDGAKPGDTTVTYDKGGWAFWMLADLIGREAAFAGLHELIAEHHDGPDFPVVQDLLAALRPHAGDPAAFDAFVDQWFYRVVVPEYHFSAVEKVRVGEGWEVRAMVHNDGTGVMPVEVAAASGERMDDGGEELADYRDARVTVTLGPGEEQEVTIPCTFEPAQLLPDPDVRVLQLNRAKALRRLGTGR